MFYYYTIIAYENNNNRGEGFNCRSAQELRTIYDELFDENPDYRFDFYLVTDHNRRNILPPFTLRH